jgi:hypothetical protein
MRPVAHHRDAVRHRQRLELVVGDVEDGDAGLALDALELDAHVLAQLGVEVRERLVEQQHVGLADERAPERDPLLLAARELARLAPRELPPCRASRARGPPAAAGPRSRRA